MNDPTSTPKRAAAPRPALALDRDVGQGTGDFRLAPADRLLVQAGDLGDQPHAAAPLAIRLDGRIPPALGLVEAAEQQIHLGVQHPVGVRCPGLAWWTLAGAVFDRTHPWHPFDPRLVPSCYTALRGQPSSLPPKREIIL